jgi:hypothetical protein
MSATTTQPTHPIRWYISVAVVLFIFVLVAFQSSRVAQDTTGYDEDQAKIRAEKLAKLQASDQKTLTTADWVDKDKGIVRIPIDEAMTEEVALLQAKPVAAGSEIPGAVAPAAPGAAPAPAPAATASGRASDNAAHPASGTPPDSTPAAPTNPPSKK